MISSATISSCGKYRYDLTRVWDISLPVMVWVMVNPSTADATDDDPTIRKCVKFARTWGFGGIVVVNLFAFRATDPKELKPLTRLEAIGPENDTHLLKTIRSDVFTVAAWGQNGKLHDRDREALAMLREYGVRIHALKQAKNGAPYHPLYMRDDTKPFPLR